MIHNSARFIDHLLWKQSLFLQQNLSSPFVECLLCHFHNFLEDVINPDASAAPFLHAHNQCRINKMPGETTEPPGELLKEKWVC